MTELHEDLASEGIPIQLRAAGETFTTLDGFLAMGFGSGLVSRAPGTAGTLVAIPLAVVLKMAGGFWFWVLLLTAFGLGVWICERVGRRLGVDDYGGIVWDEMVGFWLAIAFVSPTWYWLLIAFCLFRFFDIFKPWPISLVDEHVHGGFGVMLDDIFAGVYTIILLAGLNYIVHAL